MEKVKVLAIYRAEKFSPNSVERDKAIMDAVADLIGCSHRIKEEDISLHTKDIADASIILQMTRSTEALDILANVGNATKVVNKATAVANCSRSAVDRLMRNNNIPAAPLYGSEGWWIKRGDEAAQSKDDVKFADSDEEKSRIIGSFRERGVTDIVVTAHVNGDLVKFYGVRGTDFFHTCYPIENGFSKFGDEARNGKPHHTPFDIGRLHVDATRLAELTGINIYGGDCIVRADGSYAIIDFNDWPSFSSCREEAAKAIARLVTNIK